MSDFLREQYVASLYGLFTPWEDRNFAADVAEYFGEKRSLEIIPQPTYLGGDVTRDGPISFAVAAHCAAAMPEVVASMELSDQHEPVIVQLQAINGGSQRLSKKWPFLLVGIAEEVARRNSATSIAIKPADMNPWCPDAGQDEHTYYGRRNGRSLEEIRNGFLLRYNATAKRAGYKKGEDGLYHKTLTPGSDPL